MAETVQDEVREIKKSLRLAMNGVVSTLQRRQGLNYKINFGVEIPRLKSIAECHTPSKELAVALWQDNIRECKMLAIYLMPLEQCATVAQEWIAQTQFTEIADHLSMHLLSRMPDATNAALQWCTRPDGMFAYCGYLTLSHLLRRGTQPTAEQELTLFESLYKQNCDNGIVARCTQNTMAIYTDRVPDSLERLRKYTATRESVPPTVAMLLNNDVE
ncbi:MAG: DNA alkylation repair protein [Bacteroidaceae bacterium]|nr:DNA alkylation repair protein [Bacteroidaceae bacterium]